MKLKNTKIIIFSICLSLILGASLVGIKQIRADDDVSLISSFDVTKTSENIMQEKLSDSNVTSINETAAANTKIQSNEQVESKEEIDAKIEELEGKIAFYKSLKYFFASFTIFFIISFVFTFVYYYHKYKKNGLMQNNNPKNKRK